MVGDLTYDPGLDAAGIRNAINQKANASTVGGLSTAINSKASRAELSAIAEKIDAATIDSHLAPKTKAGAATDDQLTAWAAFRSAFAAIIDERFYPLAWVDEQVAIGNFVLMSKGDSAILLSVKVYPSGLRELTGEAATGKRETIVSALIPQAEQFGRAIGCETACISSREGWARIMKSHGYSLHQTSIRKAL